MKGAYLLSALCLLFLPSLLVLSEAHTPTGIDVDGSTNSRPACEGETCNSNKKDRKAIKETKQEVPKLPDFQNGGIFVYFHLYKTGGSSVNDLFHYYINEDFQVTNPDDHIVMVLNREDMTKEDVDYSILQVEKNRSIVFYDFHVEYPATEYPTLMEAAPILDQWRSEAKAKDIPFFVVTTIREPLGHALSFFNFFHVVSGDEDWNPFKPLMEPTEENFLKTYVPNRLCHMMYDDAHGILEAPDEALADDVPDNLHFFMNDDELNRRNEESYCDADKVRQVLFGGTFDYVGVTEQMSTHVLPIATHLVFGNASLALEADRMKHIDYIFEVEEIKKPPLKKSSLSESTKAKVLEESKIDQALYEEALEKFGRWPSLLRSEVFPLPKPNW